MKTAFLHLAQLLRSDGNVFVTFAFINLLRFWANFAFRTLNHTDAFIQICWHSLHVDHSLKMNPFRLQIISVLMEHDVYLPCVAPLVKILEKSLHEQKDSSAEFEWDTLLIAERDVARNQQYQARLFDTALDRLGNCLASLSRRVSFPEIVAPVTRVLAAMIDNPVFVEKVSQLKRLQVMIQKNANWVIKERERIANVEGFDITTVGDLEGVSPMDKN
jgi:hypothetical protein